MDSKKQRIVELEKMCNKRATDNVELQQLNSCLTELLEEKRKICTELENVIIEKDKNIERLWQQIQLSDEIGRNFSLLGQLNQMKEEKNYLFHSILSSHSRAYKSLLLLKLYNIENPDAKKKLSDEVWEELLFEVDQLTHGFVKRLTLKYERLLKDDIYFCCLAKIGMKYDDMAAIFCCTANAVYKKRNVILKRMGIELTMKFEIIIENV